LKPLVGQVQVVARPLAAGARLARLIRGPRQTRKPRPQQSARFPRLLMERRN